jgi:hypothetical protein
VGDRPIARPAPTQYMEDCSGVRRNFCRVCCARTELSAGYRRGSVFTALLLFGSDSANHLYDSDKLVSLVLQCAIAHLE